MKRKIDKIVQNKCVLNGFAKLVIDTDTELMHAGYIDSMDVVEILAEIEQETGAKPDLNAIGFPDDISLAWFYHSVDYTPDAGDF